MKMIERFGFSGDYEIIKVAQLRYTNLGRALESSPGPARLGPVKPCQIPSIHIRVIDIEIRITHTHSKIQNQYHFHQDKTERPIGSVDTN